MQQYTCPICSAIGAGPENKKYLCHVCKDDVYLLKSHNGMMVFNAGVFMSDDELVMLNPFTCNDFDWIIGKEVFIKHTIRKVIGVERFMHAESWKKGENIILKFEI